LSGFSALPAGKNNIGYFYGIADFTMFWSSSTNNNPQSLVSNADIFGLHTSQCSKLKSYNRKDDGLSVRCIKDTCSGTSANAGLDQLNITGLYAVLNGNSPAIGESVEWSVIAGIGGVFSQKYSSGTNFFKGNNDTAYSLVYKITGICGTSRDTIHLRFPAVIGNNCGQAVFYGNESYPTVNIGGQCWMSKNLNIGTMISSGTFSNNNGVIEKYCYNNDVNNCSIYGGLYDWAEMAQYQNGVTTSTPANPPITGNLRGICPSGWKIPSDEDFCFLTTYLDNSVDCNANGNSGNDGGGKMKSVSSYWNSPNVGATNSSAFSALPGGGYFPPSFGNKNVSAQI